MAGCWVGRGKDILDFDKVFWPFPFSSFFFIYLLYEHVGSSLHQPLIDLAYFFKVFFIELKLMFLHFLRKLFNQLLSQLHHKVRSTFKTTDQFSP